MKNAATMVAFLAGVFAAGACEDFGPGDYLVYRVAYELTTRSGGCYGGQPPPDEGQDTSTELTPDTWILYMGPDSKPYLDIGTTTLRGQKSGSQYTFDGQRTDVSVEDDGMGNTQTITDTLITHIVITLDGSSIGGTFEQAEDRQCSGMGCPEPFNCTTTKKLVGSEVDDVELEHEV